MGALATITGTTRAFITSKRRWPLVVLMLCASIATAYAQDSTKMLKPSTTNVIYDTSYYLSYENQLTTRFYFSKKYTALRLRNTAENYAITYLPNTTLNMGVGVTYRWFTLNLAYGFGFLNPDRGEGETKYLDLQFHSYGRKMVLDAFGQFYNGFYLNESNIKTGDEYYQRPDLRVREVGLSLQYVFNYNRFSYRAAFLQNEWQRKSAGTPLAGLEIYYGRIRADSSIVPRAIDESTTAADLHGSNFFEFGPNVGYAYTMVIKEQFFLTASASVSLTYGTNAILSEQNKLHAHGFSPNYFVRGFGGYNSRLWAISVVYVHNGVSLKTNSSDRRVFISTGNVRLNFVYRFKPGPKVKRYLRVIDRIAGDKGSGA